MKPLARRFLDVLGLLVLASVTVALQDRAAGQLPVPRKQLPAQIGAPEDGSDWVNTASDEIMQQLEPTEFEIYQLDAAARFTSTNTLRTKKYVELDEKAVKNLTGRHVDLLKGKHAYLVRAVRFRGPYELSNFAVYKYKYLMFIIFGCLGCDPTPPIKHPVIAIVNYRVANAYTSTSAAR